MDSFLIVYLVIYCVAVVFNFIEAWIWHGNAIVCMARVVLMSPMAGWALWLLARSAP